MDGTTDVAPCYVSRGQRLLFNSASRHQDAPEYLVVDQRSGEEINNKADLDALPEIAELPFLDAAQAHSAQSKIGTLD